MTMFIKVGTTRLYNIAHFRNFQVLAESEFAEYTDKLVGYAGLGEYDYYTLFLGTQAECEQMLYDIARSLDDGATLFAIEGNGTKNPIKEELESNVNRDFYEDELTF